MSFMNACAKCEHKGWILASSYKDITAVTSLDLYLFTLSPNYGYYYMHIWPYYLGVHSISNCCFEGILTVLPNLFTTNSVTFLISMSTCLQVSDLVIFFFSYPNMKFHNSFMLILWKAVFFMYRFLFLNSLTEFEHLHFFPSTYYSLHKVKDLYIKGEKLILKLSICFFTLF